MEDEAGLSVTEPPSPPTVAKSGRPGASDILCFLVGQVVARARLVLLLAVALSAFSGWAVTTLGINTDTTGLISKDLPFRKTFAEYRRNFPWFKATVIVVIDGASVDAAEDGAARLYKRMSANRGQFISLFYPQSESFFRRNGLLYLSIKSLERFSDQVASAQPFLAELTRDPSLRGLYDVLRQAIDRLGTAEGKPGQLAPVLDRISTVIEAQSRGQRAQLAWSEVLSGDTVKKSDRRRIIVVQPKLDFKSLTPAKKAMDQIRAWAKELGLTPANGVRLRMTGSAAIGSEELKSVTVGAQLAGILSFIFVTILLTLGLRSARLVIGVVITLILGLLWTAGFAAISVGTLNLLSVAFAVLFIGLGVDFGIHFALRCREERGEDVNRRQAIILATRGVGAGLVLSAAAAAVAFLSFLPTEYRGVSELGLIAGAGMAIALTASLTVLPAILALWPERADLRALPDWHKRGAGQAVQQALTRARRPIVIGALVLGVAGAALAPWSTFDRNPLNLKDPSTESVATAIDLMSDPDTPVTGISILTPGLQAANKLAKKLRQLPAVRSVRTVSDLIPKKQQEKLDIIEEVSLVMVPVWRIKDTAKAPDMAARRASARALQKAIGTALAAGKAGTLKPRLERLARALAAFDTAAAAQAKKWAALEKALVGGLPARMASLREALNAGPVRLGDIPHSLRVREVSASGKVRIFVSPKGDLRDADTLQQFVDQVSAVAPNATGAPVVEHRAGDEVVRAFMTATIIAGVLIILALLALFRRVLDVLLVMTPVAIAGAMTIGVMVIFDISFNFANIIVVPLLIGLGVASGIHLVMRARKDGQELMGSSTPRAILFSALTTVASFGSLMVSGHRGTASMGELLTIAISLTLICALVVLPGLVSLVGVGKSKNNGRNFGKDEGERQGKATP